MKSGKQSHEVKVFLMGEAVECEGLTHEKYNVDEQLKIFVNLGGELLACGTCLKSRQLKDSDTRLHHKNGLKIHNYLIINGNIF